MNQVAPLAKFTPAVRLPSADVTAALTFMTPPSATGGGKPYFLSSAYTGGAPQIHFDSAQHEVSIEDMRPLAGALSLDHEGFELHRHNTAVQDLYDDEVIERIYYPEIEALLRRITGASRVVIFDVTRRSDNGTGAKNRDGLRGPATRVHVDYTEKSGPQRVRDLLGEAEAARLAASGARIMQINVWRPIRGPLLDAPLALGDARTIAREHLVPTELRFPDRTGEVYSVVFDTGQRWYYFPRLAREEAVLIKCYDSREDGTARFSAHSAFDDPTTPLDAPPRESIEARSFLFFAPEA